MRRQRRCLVRDDGLRQRNAMAFDPGAEMQTMADPKTGQTVGPSVEFVYTQGGMG